MTSNCWQRVLWWERILWITLSFAFVCSLILAINTTTKQEERIIQLEQALKHCIGKGDSSPAVFFIPKDKRPVTYR